MLTTPDPDVIVPPAPADRRQWYRYPCGQQVYCRLIIDGVVDFWAMCIQDLSPGGVKLVVDIPFPVGKVLTAVLYNPARRYSCQRQLGVAYSRPAGKVRHETGGRFNKELSTREMRDLL